MSSDQALLSICYATLGRKLELEASIRSLLVYCDTESIKSVELVIVDSSDSETSLFIQSLCKKVVSLFSDVKYHWIPPSGTDQAYAQAVNIATSDFVWLLADDDKICSHISPLLSSLKQLTPANQSCLLINMSLMSPCMTHVYVSSLASFPESRSDRTFSLNQILHHSDFLSSHISFVIFPRQQWLKTYIVFPEFPCLKIAGVNLALALKYALPYPTPLLQLRSGHQSWLAQSFSIWYLYWPSLLLFLGIKPRDLFSLHIYKKISFLRNLIFYKACGATLKSKPILPTSFFPLHLALLKVVRLLPRSACLKISIMLSAFSRYPPITLSQLAKHYEC